MQAEAGEFRRGWGTVLASLSGLAFGVAALAISYTIGVFLGPLNEEFGWSRQQILFAGTIVSVAVVGLSPVVGWITDRYGVRRMIIGSQLGFGLGFAGLATFTANLWTFYAGYFLMALMASGTIAVTFSKLLTTEFIKHRGLALGLAMSGTGLCGFIVPPFAAYVVETFGWRTGYFSLGLLPVCLALPLTLKFLHDTPRAGMTATDSAQAADILGEVKAGKAFRSYRFWAMGITFLLASCTMTALITNFVPILGDQDYPPTEAAAIAGTFGLAVITGRVIVGLLIDRIWAPLVGFALFTPAALAIVLLGLGALETTGLIIAIATAGFAAGAEVDLMGYLVARYFGLKHFGKIYAGLYVMFALGPGITTPLFGGARDTFGSYELALYVAAAGLAFAGVLLITLGPYPRTSTEGMSK